MGIMKRQDSTTGPWVLLPPNYASINAVVACSIVFTLLATIVVGLRISIRRSRTHLCAEDWLIVAALPFMYAEAVTALMAVYRGGVGYSTIEVFNADPNILTISLQCLFAMELIYAILITLIKLSVLAMYRSLFPTPLLRKGTDILGVAVILWWLAVVLVTFLQSRPLNALWDLRFFSTAVFLDKVGLFLGNAIPNIIIDVFILALPLYEVATLQMVLVKKTGVFMIFLFGGVTVVISGLRLQSGMSLLTDPTADVTHSAGSLWAWTVVETSMGIICACLPTVGGAIVGIIVRLITTPKATVRNESTSKRSGFKPIGTIGGGSGRAIHRPAFAKVKGDDSTGSFERLEDESGETSVTNLWPKGYQGERETTVSGRRISSEQSDDIPLSSITVKQEMCWSESKAASSP
ncbi:hypothetical protein JX265_012491 [Neoarthrinium moseri]|uniref:Rhodopsin domain-containing protein n=1 Tax=Neoarthrinium moseri TaxID=1658444 RepID=A0A9Q0AJM5_9PEZI|nr:hypothetical protein JX265_012491 [Neoarthrinium moseri]